MKSLILTAAVAMLSSGAFAQSECQLHCSKDKAGAAITQVADEAKTCSAEQIAECAAKAQACEGNAAECAAKAQACSEGASGAAVTLAALPAAGPDCDGCATGKGDCAKCAAKAQRVSFESWRKTVPVMGYSVGEKTTTCSKTAAAMAASSDSEMTYVVDGQSYESMTDAMAAHTARLNAYLDSMTRVSFVVGDENMECPMSAGAACEKTGQAMRYRVGPAVFDTAEEAVRAAAMAYGMSKSVAMTYEVDGETTTCSKSAATMSESCGKGMKYVVGGVKTECNVQADNLLASQRISKALEALEMATSQS